MSSFHRAPIVLMLLLTLVVGCFGTVGAQDTVTGNADVHPFANLGLPEIVVTVTDNAIDGVPAELSAGRYVLAVTNDFVESPEETAGAAFLRLPDDISAGEFLADVRDAEAGVWPRDWYYSTTLAGGPYALPGETAYAVIDLTAGEWLLWTEAPEAPQAPVLVTVTGEALSDSPVPAADTTIELSDFAFDFGGELNAGVQIIEVVNSGTQPHFVFIGGVPDGTTVDDALAAFEAYWDPETAPTSEFSFAETPELLGTGDQSAGTTAWYAIDLPAGTVVVACFVTDPETGLPHAMLGMTTIEVIE